MLTSDWLQILNANCNGIVWILCIRGEISIRPANVLNYRTMFFFPDLRTHSRSFSSLVPVLIRPCTAHKKLQEIQSLSGFPVFIASFLFPWDYLCLHLLYFLPIFFWAVQSLLEDSSVWLRQNLVQVLHKKHWVTPWISFKTSHRSCAPMPIIRKNAKPLGQVNEFKANFL